jgi:Uma2 family endonuclease
VATKAQIRAEDYLRMSFEHDAEFVRGEIVERYGTDWTHSTVQFNVLMQFGNMIQSGPLYPLPELRMKLADDVYRVTDVCVYVGRPQQLIPETPPLAVIEIICEDDRYVDVVQKVDEYRAWGVPNIWLIDPMVKRLEVCTEWGIRYVPSFSLPDYFSQLTPAELFENL